MFGLSCDFIQQDGITMLLGRQDGLSGGEINPVQARMLMNSDIPHHLRLQLREMDLQITLAYAVGRRRMLSHLLVGEKFSMMDFFGLLLQIAGAMEEGRLYMLRPEQYALHEDYIFVDGPLKGGKIYLTCLPLQPGNDVPVAGERLKALMMVLLPAVTELAGSGVQKLLHYCAAEDFTPSGLKRLLSELLTGEDLLQPTRDTPPQDAGIARPYTKYEAEAGRDSRQTIEGSFRVREAAALRQPQHSQQPSSEFQTQSPQIRGEEERYPKLRMKAEPPGTDRPLPQMPEEPVQLSAYRTYVVLGSILLGALAWKLLYISHPTTLLLGICTLVTLLLAAISWLVWSGKITVGGEIPGPAGTEDEEAGVPAGWGTGVGNGMGLRREPELVWDFGRDLAAAGIGTLPASVPASVPAKPEPELQQPAFKNYRLSTYEPAGSNPEQGSLVSEPPPAADTVLLSHTDAAGGDREAKRGSRAAPYLERIQEDGQGAVETIELNRSSFIIGRSSEVAQYVEKSEGASRVHAEISRGPAGYVLKDLDSRNGTLYQGEAMVPYKEYPLSDGTVFSIVKGRYTFRLA
ncbi:DUF6382 domain-containing protein [Paenibacillus tepidiphilus]|uniref:DUF6382 domain-containing protein n=1 Tax=Paenibacillus tepidiphilus TaxID=2608683 RepID=UPI00123A123D|nr:DUF6382 domain-containing protein [Paenibacillus tepidiphilus]